jgi:hypothetical protein
VGVFGKKPLQYENSRFALTLPHGWRLEDDGGDGTVQFVRGSWERVLTVGVVGIADPPSSPEALLRDVSDFYDVRMNTERSFLAVDDPPLFAEGVETAGDQALGYFCGVQGSSDRLFAGFVTGKYSSIVTIYHEAPLGTDLDRHRDETVDLLVHLVIKQAV